MKNIIFTCLLTVSVLISASAQQEQKSRRELRQEKQEQKKEEIKKLLNERSYVFKPTHAMPLGGGSIYLSHSYDAEIKGDTLISYLPFYGVAYRAEYGSRKSAFDFTGQVEKYELEKKDDEYRVSFDVKNKMDFLTYNFYISEIGFATLNVTSTNRQAISFYGYIEAPEEN